MTDEFVNMNSSKQTTDLIFFNWRNKMNPEQIYYFMTSIVAATLSGSKVYASSEFLEPYRADGTVVVNVNDVNENGVACIATPLGIERFNEQIDKYHASVQMSAARAPLKAKPSVEFQMGIPKPEVVRHIAKRGSRYPIADMPVGASYFLPNGVGKDGKTANATKRLASLAESEKVRSAIKTGEQRTTRTGQIVDKLKYTKAFSVRAYVENGVEGARIWRDEDPV